MATSTRCAPRRWRLPPLERAVTLVAGTGRWVRRNLFRTRSTASVTVVVGSRGRLRAVPAGALRARDRPLGDRAGQPEAADGRPLPRRAPAARHRRRGRRRPRRRSASPGVVAPPPGRTPARRPPSGCPARRRVADLASRFWPLALGVVRAARADQLVAGPLARRVLATSAAAVVGRLVGAAAAAAGAPDRGSSPPCCRPVRPRRVPRRRRRAGTSGAG